MSGRSYDVIALWPLIAPPPTARSRAKVEDSQIRVYRPNRESRPLRIRVPDSTFIHRATAQSEGVARVLPPLDKLNVEPDRRALSSHSGQTNVDRAESPTA